MEEKPEEKPEENQEENKEEMKESLLVDHSEEKIPPKLKQEEMQLKWYIFSLLSWFLLISVQIEAYVGSFFKPYNKYAKDLPAIRLFILVLTIVGLVVYLIFTTCKKEQNLFHSMIGGPTKLHFISLLCFSALFIIDEYNNFEFIKQGGFREYETKYNNGIQSTSLIFSLIGLVILIIVYINMNLPCEWYIVQAIKKGVFSCYIPYVTLRVLDSIYNLVSINTGDSKESLGLNIIEILILIGLALISLCFSYVYSDIVMSITNLIIYIGFLIYFSVAFYDNYDRLPKSDKVFLILFEVITVLVIVLSLLLIIFLIVWQKDKLFK